MNVDRFMPEDPEIDLREKYRKEMTEDERREAREEIRTERLELLGGIFRSRLMSTGINFIPGIDVSKLTLEAVRGRTLSGKELKANNRLNYMIIASTFAMAYGMMLAGHPEQSATTLVAGGVMAKLEFFGPELKEHIGAALGKISGAIGRLFSAGYDFAETHPDETRHIWEEMTEAQGALSESD